LLIDARGQAQAIDPDRIFHRGERVVFEFEPNRSGYLYVLEQASSGKWRPLFPLVPEQDNVVKAQTKMTVPPKEDAFEITGVPGVERVFVVLSRNPEDPYELTEAIRNDAEGATRPVATQSAQAFQSRDQLNEIIERMKTDLASRELKTVKISQPQAPTDPPNSVFVVNVSNTPTDRVVTEIRINHPQ
jgi:hypothetical protein